MRSAGNQRVIPPSPRARWLDYFGAWLVIARTVMLVKGTLVPAMVAAPKVQVWPPSEIVFDSAGAGRADRVCCVQPRPDSRSVHPIIHASFIYVCLL